MKFNALLTRLKRDIKAATAVEYGLIAALLVVATMTALSGMAGAVSSTWNNVNTQSQRAVAQATGG